jgi:hypothetical protein
MTSGSAMPVNFGHPIKIQLTTENHLFWRAQVVSHLWSNLLYGFVDGTFPCPEVYVSVAKDGGDPVQQINPDYAAWVQQDQAILSAILSSATVDVVGMIMFTTTSHEA